MSTNGSDDLADVLARAELPTDKIPARRAALPGPLRDLHRRVLTSFAGTGAPPTAAELTVWATDYRLDLHEACANSAERSSCSPTRTRQW